jgi:hypothetical protein
MTKRRRMRTDPGAQPVRAVLETLLLAAGAACLLAVGACGHLQMPPQSTADRPAPVETLPTLPEYDDPAWLLSQGLPLRRDWLREGRTPVDGGEMFILPYVLTALPYKNVQETDAWVDEVNRRLHPSPPWVYQPERRMGHYKCMSVSASTVLDWFTLTQGKPLPGFRSWLNGSTERGSDHRVIDAIYYQRAASGENRGYRLVTTHLDPVEQTPISFRMEAFARIITMAGDPEVPREQVVVAPDMSLPGVTHRARAADFLDVPYHVVFQWTPSTQVARDPEPYTRMLVDALEKHGPIYAGIRVRFASSGGIVAEHDIARLAIPNVSGHGVVIVGYVRQAGRTYFIYRETFGDFDDEFADGGPAYRAYPVHGFNEAYTFHR